MSLAGDTHRRPVPEDMNVGERHDLIVSLIRQAKLIRYAAVARPTHMDIHTHREIYMCTRTHHRD